MSASYLALLLADGRLPTGAHTQSAGVEPALRHGMRVGEVPGYLRVRLTTVTEVEAAAAVVAGRVWAEQSPSDDADLCEALQQAQGASAERPLQQAQGASPERPLQQAQGGSSAERPLSLSKGPEEVGVAQSLRAALGEVDRAWRVRTLSDALREASDLLGRSYLRTAAAVWDLAVLTDSDRPWCRAVVLGVVAANAGLDTEQTARLVAYEDVQTVVAAALKLEPFDPALGVRWAAGAALDVEAMVARVADARTTDDIPAHSAPLVEEWGQRHRTSERRLFRA